MIKNLDEILEEMIICKKDEEYDPEVAHIKADKLLINTIYSLSNECACKRDSKTIDKIIEVYNNIAKRYY